MIDKKALQKNFSKNAVNYDAFAKVQKKMARELFEGICFEPNRAKDSLDILDVGCGTGYLSELMLKGYPNANITAVDIAPGMIEWAKQKLAGKGIEFLCADIEEVALNRKFDIIVSNAAFQWFNRLEDTISKLKARLKDNGILAFSTFGPMTFNELRQSFESAKGKLNLADEPVPIQQFFSREALVDICLREPADDQASVNKAVSLEKHEYEYFDTVRDFLKSVQKAGANNSNCQRKTIPSLIKETMRNYETMFIEGNRIKATYHCIFIVLEKEKSVSMPH